MSDGRGVIELYVAATITKVNQGNALTNQGWHVHSCADTAQTPDGKGDVDVGTCQGRHGR